MSNEQTKAVCIKNWDLGQWASLIVHNEEKGVDNEQSNFFSLEAVAKTRLMALVEIIKTHSNYPLLYRQIMIVLWWNISQSATLQCGQTIQNIFVIYDM